MTEKPAPYRDRPNQSARYSLSEGLALIGWTGIFGVGFDHQVVAGQVFSFNRYRPPPDRLRNPVREWGVVRDGFGGIVDVLQTPLNDESRDIVTDSWIDSSHLGLNVGISNFQPPRRFARLFGKNHISNVHTRVRIAALSPGTRVGSENVQFRENPNVLRSGMTVILQSEIHGEHDAVVIPIKADGGNGFDSNPSPAGNVHSLLRKAIGASNLAKLPPSNDCVRAGSNHNKNGADDVRLGVSATPPKPCPPTFLQCSLLSISGLMLMLIGGFVDTRILCRKITLTKTNSTPF